MVDGKGLVRLGLAHAREDVIAGPGEQRASVLDTVGDDGGAGIVAGNAPCPPPLDASTLWPSYSESGTHC